jgi:hypothetical protein
MELHSRFQDLLLEKEDHLCLEWIDALRVVLIVGERNAKGGSQDKEGGMFRVERINEESEG